MKDPCVDATIIIDPLIIDSSLEFDVFAQNQPKTYSIDTALITLSTEALGCPDFDLSIVNDDDSSIDDSVFSYNQALHEFTIDTRDMTKIGTFQMKIVAKFVHTYMDIVTER